ncbi:hypothetical protein EV182_005289, partial [Spiromyces aspiralis]
HEAALRRLYDENANPVLGSGATGDSGPALHRVAETLAKYYEVDINTVRKALLNEYLSRPVRLHPSPHLESGQHVDKYLPSFWLYHQPVSAGRDTDTGEVSLRRRIAYILEGYPLEEVVPYLLEYAYKSHSKVSTLNRIRALDILFTVASPRDIQLTHDPEEVKKYMCALIYLVDFEHLQILQTCSEFLECSKTSLARTLWLTHHRNPKARWEDEISQVLDICQRSLFLADIDSAELVSLLAGSQSLGSELPASAIFLAMTVLDLFLCDDGTLDTFKVCTADLARKTTRDYWGRVDQYI